MQRTVETLIAKKIIADDIEPRTILRVDYDGNALFVEAEAEATVS